MGLFGKKKNKIAEAEPAAEAAPGAGLAAEGDDELICVIAAAIAAYEADQYGHKLYIRKLDRSAGVRPAWGVMGVTEAIDTRRM